MRFEHEIYHRFSFEYLILCIVLVWEIVEPLGDGDLLEEVSHDEDGSWSLYLNALPFQSLLPGPQKHEESWAQSPPWMPSYSTTMLDGLISNQLK